MWKIMNCSRPDAESLFVALEEVLGRTALRPVHSLSTPTNVSIELTIFGILGVDEKQQQLATFIWLVLEWEMETVKWDPLQCGASRISLPRTMLWTPDILINEFMDEDTSPDAPYVYLKHTGHVFDDRPVRVVSSCTLDIYAFPFDVQNCSLTFGSYLHVASDIQVALGRNVSDALQESRRVLRAAGEWELLDLTATDSTLHTSHSQYHEVVFYVVLRRRATLYVVNLLVPSCFLITVDLFSFLLPPQSVDRSSFKMTLILGYTVFLLIMNDLLPITGNRTPLINVFFSICLALMVGSLLETVLITNILYSSSQYPSVPRWIRVIVLQYLARLVCLYQKPSNRVTVILNPAAQVPAEKCEAAAGPSVLPGPHELQGPKGNGHSYEQLILQELRRLSADLLAIRLKMDKSQQGSQNAEEWVQIGNVIDRLLFCLYLVFISVSFITIIMIWAHWHNQ
ncbi:5-hydroxytryptamine receptor 3A-like [Anguilla rostrata]|uniref:5-hydroxytryptamine receptor 3A-like n=1 Tax=Anguilla rostrata TaxID=7938 RepID=UPI0030CC4DB5